VKSKRWILFGVALTLLLLAAGATVLAFLQPHATAATCSPPVAGDWTVSGEEVCSDQTITLAGNLNISGTLTLERVRLELASTTDGQYGIYVQGGGTLIVNNSTITSASPSAGRYEPENRYKFQVYGRLEINNNSDISGLYTWTTGGWVRHGGIELYSGRNIIQNSHIHRASGNGILVWQSSDGDKIIGNTFSDLDTPVNLMSTNTTVSGNHFEGNAGSSTGAIHVWFTSGNVIENNTFINNGPAIWLEGWIINLTIAHNTFTSNSAGISSPILYDNPDNKGWNISFNTFANSPVEIQNLYGAVWEGNTFTDSSLQFTNSHNMKIYNNNFMGDLTDVEVTGGTGNVFNLDAPIGGNYWSSFDTPAEGCNNLNGDSFCDAPCVFPGGQDNLPWTSENGWLTDLSVTKADRPDPALVGQTLTYVVTLTNNGPSAATGVTVTDTLPSSVAFVSATPTQGSCAQSGGTVSCSIGSLANGATATVTILVTPGAAGTITNTARVMANESDANTANNTATASTTVNPAADLSMTKSDTPDPVLVGQKLTYTVSLTNNGPSAATGVTVTDTLPPSVAFVSATPTQGSCAQSGGTVTCSIGKLANGATATVTIVVTPGAAGTITNTASVTGSEFDPNTTNNTAAASTTVSPVTEVSITKSDSPDPVPIGQNLTYTLTVTNNGPSLATGVLVTDTLPSSVAFVSATPSQGSCTRSGGTVTCNVGNLANGATATVRIVVKPTVVEVITNKASVKSNEFDPNTANNTATASTTVNPAADLSITKSDFPDPVLVRQRLTYAITLTNRGPSAATGVMVTDTLPSSAIFISATPSQGSCTRSGATVTCTIGTLANGATARVTIVVTPTAVGTITNRVSVRGNEVDPNTANNDAMATTKVCQEGSLEIASDPTDKRVNWQQIGGWFYVTMYRFLSFKPLPLGAELTKIRVSYEWLYQAQTNGREAGIKVLLHGTPELSAEARHKSPTNVWVSESKDFTVNRYPSSIEIQGLPGDWAIGLRNVKIEAYYLICQ